MATQVTKFPADGAFGKSVFVELKDRIQTLINIGMITTASTITELQTALNGQIDNDDPRS